MSIDEIVERLMPRVIPDENERNLLFNTVKIVVERLDEEIKRRNLNAKVEVQGSVAHGTWLPGDRDIDVFILFDPSVGKEYLVNKGLEVAKAVFPDYIERYADHPFITARVNGFLVDIVPAAMVSDASKLVTAADRTPLHTKYLLSVLTDELRMHAKILKLFVKSLGVYGAEIKVQGFSGYLVELLTVIYNGFPNFIRNAANWVPYKTVLPSGENVFNDPLVVIDPVDPKRNVASPVSLESMSIVIQASRMMLKNPSLKFFEVPIERKLNNSSIRRLRARGSHLIAIVSTCPKIPSDVLWGELRHSMYGIQRLMENHDFNVIDSMCWSDEHDNIIFVYEVRELKLPKVKVVRGPPIGMRDACERFVESHKDVWIRGDVLYAYSERGVTDVRKLLKEKIFTASLSRHVMEEFRKGFEVYTDYQVLSIKGGFLVHARKFVEKSLWWIKN